MQPRIPQLGGNPESEKRTRKEEEGSSLFLEPTSQPISSMGPPGPLRSTRSKESSAVPPEHFLLTILCNYCTLLMEVDAFILVDLHMCIA